MKENYKEYQQSFDDAIIKVDGLNFAEIYEAETGNSFNRHRQTVCPFCGSGDHGSGSTAAFTYYPASNLAKCFACGESTGTVGFIMFHKNLKYKETIHYISKYYLNTELQNPYGEIKFPATNIVKKVSERKKASEAEKLQEAKDKAEKFAFLRDLVLNNTETKEATEYLVKRGFIVDKLPKTSYYQSNKYKNLPSGVVFFDTEKKLLNKRYTTNDLPDGIGKSFNFGELKNSVYAESFIEDYADIYITEGVINALSIYQEGLSAIALFATTNMIDDVAKFEKYFHDKNIILAFDNDRAGLQAAIKTGLFIVENFNIRSLQIILFPSKKDANDLFQKNYLNDFLRNQLNYSTVDKEFLTTELQKIKEDLQYIPQITLNNYHVRKTLPGENVGYKCEVAELMSDTIDKLKGSDMLSANDFLHFNIKYLKQYSVITEKWVHTHSSIEKDPIFIIEDKIVWRPFAKAPFKEIEFLEDIKEWIFGYTQLSNAAASAQKELECAELPEEGAKKKPAKQPKFFAEICIVYSVRDALNIFAIGMMPIYFEGSSLDYEIYKDFEEWADNVYQFPSRNIKHKAKSKALSLQHIDIKTFTIPEDSYSYNLSEYFKTLQIKDKAFKTDYFKRMLNRALPLKFWEWENRDYAINSIKLNHYLNLCGYFTYKSLSNKAGYIYLQIDGKIVKKIDPDKENFSRIIKYNIDNYLEKRGETTKLRSKLMKATELNESNLSSLREISLDLDNSGKSYQNWFFKDGNMWTVTRNGIKVYKQTNVKKFVWEDEILDMPSEVLSKQFEIRYSQKYNELKEALHYLQEGTEEYKAAKKNIYNLKLYDTYEIEILNPKNYFLQFLWLTSYAYWEEVEELGIKIQPEDFWFNLKDKLSETKIKEMKLHLINKLTWLGYFMRDYKNLTDDFGLAILDAVDNNPRIKKKGSAGGGKSIITKAIRQVKRTMILKAEKEDFPEDKHRYELYNGERVIVCDDMHQASKIGNMLTDFSEGIEVNPKHKRPTKLSFQQSPKIIITRNYIDDEGERVDRRLGRIFVFPFFHDAKSGRFKESRRPHEYFKRQLFEEDTAYDKQCLMNLFANCYIANQIFTEINPPMTDIEIYRMRKRIGETLLEFCDNYFDQNGYGYLDRVWFFKKFQDDMRPVMNNFERTNLYASSQKFQILISDYCQLKDLIFNPKELITDEENQRIIKYSNVRYDNPTSAEPKRFRCEHFYINTREGFEKELTEIEQEKNQKKNEAERNKNKNIKQAEVTFEEAFAETTENVPF